jgi:serine/threonine protein phosphatase 1
MKRVFALGDPHGGYKSLMQCFKRSKFNYEKDKLIVLGDVCDGWPETKAVIDELLKVKHLILIAGNHDSWSLNWMKHGVKPNIWVEQGGYNTINSYGTADDVPPEHLKFLESAHLYYEENNKLFIHGGLTKYSKKIENQKKHDILWDRKFFEFAVKQHNKFFKAPQLTKYNDIFIGHTTTLLWKTTKPMHCCEVWNLDTGGGWDGKLTIMDIETKEYWQSDLVKNLYPESKGRSDYKDVSDTLLNILNFK